MKLDILGFFDVRNTNITTKKNSGVHSRAHDDVIWFVTIRNMNLAIINRHEFLFGCSWRLKNHDIPNLMARGQICKFWKNRRVYHQEYIVWFLWLNWCSWRLSTSIYPYSRSMGKFAIFPKNRPVDPQVYVLGILSCQTRIQQASKPHFHVFSRIFVFFLTESYILRGIFEGYCFTKKNLAQYWKTILPKV